MESKRFSPPSDTRVRIRHTWRLLLHTSRSSAGNTTNTMYVQRCASITGCIHTDTALLWVYILSDFFVRCSFSLSQSKSFLHTFFFNSMTEKPPTRNIRLFTTGSSHQAITTPHTMDWKRRKRRMEKWSATLGVFCWPHNITSLSHAHANCYVFSVSSSNQRSKIEHIGTAMDPRSCARRG